MELTNETVVICRYCVKRMQVAETVWNEDRTKVVAQRYICGCQSPPFQCNIHAGDKHQEKS